MVIGTQPIPEEVVQSIKLMSSNFNIRTERVPIFTDNELRQLIMPVMMIVG